MRALGKGGVSGKERGEKFKGEGAKCYIRGDQALALQELETDGTPAFRAKAGAVWVSTPHFYFTFPPVDLKDFSPVIETLQISGYRLLYSSPGPFPLDDHPPLHTLRILQL